MQRNGHNDLPLRLKQARGRTLVYHITLHILAILLILYVNGFTLPQEYALSLTVALAVTFVLYFFVQGSDPGYVRPETIVGEDVEDNQPLWHTSEEIEATLAQENIGPDKESTVEQEEEEEEEDKQQQRPEEDQDEMYLRRNCVYCEQRKPARAHHCRICDRCVHGFSHHCGVLNTCIGERNACRFFWYALSQMFTVVIGLASLHFALANRNPKGFAMGLGIALAIAMWILTLMLLGLVALHGWLAISNTTGFEARHRPETVTEFQNLDIHHPEIDMPFSRGILRNLQEFCCINDGICYQLYNKPWRPQHWRIPTREEIRASENSERWWENPWRNRYWDCC
eukprot:gb/GECG01006784.1/.p1 GENE.gb/GECG01006784.1/~~gb/GECG01006784.1/.p1  ORF type:complete len:341 (+),score=28.68 gb/GECG01006784.1/:1-1023(+)